MSKILYLRAGRLYPFQTGKNRQRKGLLIVVNHHPLGCGQPRVPDRTCADGIFYVLRTGCQWKALDATGICSGSTAHLLFQQWVAAGVFLKLWRVGLERYDELKGLDWCRLSMDGTMTKASLGGGKTGPNPTDRGKGGVKRSLLTEAAGIPVGLAVDGANRHDMKLMWATVDSLAVPRPTPSPDHPPGMCLDKGYDFAEARRTLEEIGFTPTTAVGAKKPRPSSGKLGTKPGAGWWNALMAG